MQGTGGTFAVVCALAAMVAPAAHATPVTEGKPFGFNANLGPAGEVHPSVRTLDAAQAAGATHMRVSINWRNYESTTAVTNPVPASFSVPVGQPTGHFETDRVDAEYRAITERGMKPVLIVYNAPAWASTFHTCLTNPLHRLNNTICPKDWNKKPIVLYPGRDRWDAWHAFAAAVTRRYPEAVIEGTNEPDFQQQFWTRYHPPMDIVAGGQCVLRGAVRSVDPDRTILSASMFLLEYAREYLREIAAYDCFDHLSIHSYGWLEVRSGPASQHRVHLENIRDMIATLDPGMTIWLTETGMTNLASYNTQDFSSDDGERLGEDLVARAFPGYIRFWASQPEVAGLLVHSVREGSFGETGEHEGFGLLSPQYAVKDPGPGALPRFCWLVLSAGNAHPGCEGHSLPGPPAPAAPSFFREPHLVWGSETGVGSDSHVIFFEQGHPAPDVHVVWQRCDALGVTCVPVLEDRDLYRVQPEDRFGRIKVVVTLTNEHGSVTRETALGPVVR